MNVIEYLLDENEESGVNAISLVKDPAIELDFVVLNSQKEIALKVVDKERRVLMGAVLVPNKPILRISPEGEEYYIYFSKETLEKVRDKYMRKGLQGESTLDHKIKLNNQEVYLTEIWIKEDDIHDKSVLHGIEAPIGSIMGSMKIESDEILQMAKAGEIKGFSIEGLFSDAVHQSKVTEDERLLNEIRNILKNKING